MKAIILAAGRGTRMKPLTDTTPKPLISIAGKPILEHNLEHIYNSVDEIIIVIKYLGEKIKHYFGDNFKGTKITYFEQGKDKGTAAALRGIQCSDDVFIIYGDQILEKRDYETILEYNGFGALAKKVSQPEKYGIYQTDSKGFAQRLVEKPSENIGNLANIGGFKFSSEIFDIVKNIPLSPRGEYEIPDALNIFLKNNKFRVFEAQGEFIDVGAPWDILEANSYFLKKLESSQIHGEIEEGVTIKGNIILEKGAILKSGTYIEGNCYIGKDSKIGPNCYIRGETVIGNNCHIGNAVEVKNTSIGNNTNAGHLTYLGDSVIGNNINFGCGFIVANLRHDGKNMRCIIDGKLIDTGKRKLGVIVGDNAKIGIKSMAYPARVIETGAMLLPGTIVK